MNNPKFINISGVDRNYYVNISNIALIEEIEGGYDRVVFYNGTDSTPMVIESETHYQVLIDEIERLNNEVENA